jgi:NitT/TauT family transport system permease protein
MSNRACSGAIALLIVFGCWEGLARLLDIPSFILPTPSSVFKRVVADYTSGLILYHVGVTFIEVMMGFALAVFSGILLGSGIALINVFDRMVYPCILALQTIPKIAIAPLLIIWFGVGVQSKVMTAALIAFFPILVNVITGLKTVEPRRILLMNAIKASPWQTFIKVRVPSMLPYLFAGFEIGIIFSVTGAIVGEFIGSSEGLGSLIIQRQASVDVVGVFSALVYLSAMGIVLNLALRLASRRYILWAIHEGTARSKQSA